MNMQTCEVTELHYLPPTNPTSYPAHFGFTQNNTHTFEFNRLTNPLYRPHINSQVQVFNPKVTCFSSNSTADEADEQQLSLINERRQSRMISNRESARRSRMRKQKHLNELCSQVVWLMNENGQLVDKLNDASECHEKVLQENVQLKEETSKLRQMLAGMQFNSPYQTLADLDDFPCNTSYLRTESSNQSTISSTDLLH